MNYWLFSCSDISRLVSDAMDRKLPFHRRLGIRFHLLMCRYCARYRKQLFQLRRLIRFGHISTEDSACEVSLPEDTRKRISAMVRQQLDKNV